MSFETIVGKIELHYGICSQCDYSITFLPNNRPDQEFCPRCGNTLVFECPGCHAPIRRATSKHCSSCGTRVKGATGKLPMPTNY